jgi:hypothetical protein
MWNNWVEKAKVMASDIDKQLNEAVGIDADSSTANTGAGASGTNDNNAASSSATAPTATELKVTDDDDVWNDDFDFDDNELVTENDSKAAQKDVTATSVEAAPPDVDVASTEPETPTSPELSTSSIPEKEVEIESSPQSVASSSPAKEEAEQQNTEDQAIPSAATPAVASMEDTAPNKLDRAPTTTPKEEAPQQSPQSTALAETPAEAGWDEDGDDDMEFSETNQNAETSPTTATPATPPRSESPQPTEPDSPPDPGAALAKASQMMFGTFGRGGNQQSATPAEEPAPANDDASEIKPHTAGRVGGLFSSFAHRAEGGVSSLLNAAAHLAVEDDSDKVMNKAKSENDLGTMNEWDEPDDLDITEHDGNAEASVVASASQDTAKDDKELPPVTITESESSTRLDEALEIQSAELIQNTLTKSVTTVASTDDAVDGLADSFEEVSGPAHLSQQECIQQEEKAAISIDANVPVTNIEDDPRYKQLQEALRQREDQLANKAEQLNELQNLMESQEQDFKQKLQDTKEEAKKRIQRAKERCEAAEARLRLSASAGSEDAAKQELIISELRAEGEALAMKQMAMEQSVRAAKAETRELREHLQDETTAKDKALEKVKSLEAELKATKDSLNAARKGESLSSKLENDLMAARSDAEMKANTILSLQQHIKELTSESKDLKDEIEKIRKAAAHEAQQEKTNMRREHTGLISDLEQKLRTTEREAGVREDALRHEVAELRKRWQDAVRRADGKLFSSRRCAMQSHTANSSFFV